MKQRIVCVSLLSLVGACASTKHSATASSAAKAQFEALKALEGDWSGTAEHGGPPMPLDVSYRVTAAGSVVEETLFRGTPHEMVTMYHLDGDRLMLTHYCSAGNQPRMHETTGDPHALVFTFSDGTNLDASVDSHMHSGRIVFRSDGRVEEWWQGWSKGAPEGEAHFVIERKKSRA